MSMSIDHPLKRIFVVWLITALLLAVLVLGGCSEPEPAWYGYCYRHEVVCDFG